EAVVLKIGETATLTATVNPENTTDKTVTWASSNPGVATVDANGKITAIALGEAVVTATCGEAKAECNVGVTAVPVESVKLDKQALEMKVGETATLTATVAPDNATYKTVTWTSSDPNVATVDSEGKVTAVGVGKAVITAACGEAKAECMVTVNPIPVESVKLDKAVVELKVGEAITLIATVTPYNATYKTVTWSSSNEVIATVDADGVITAIAVGEAVITASCEGAKAECKVNVTAVPAENVKLDKQAMELKVGDVKTLTATVTPDNTTYKTITWSSSNSNIASVDANGKVTAIALGEAVIIASCGEAKAECIVTVTANSGIETADANEAIVTVSSMTITVSGISDDCKVSIYTVTGELITSETGCCTIAVANRGVYIVKVGNQVVKVAI
ncbi:MAG: Ig-like domain-containing protein, partial [Paramuribaculum sp.]|nr:Ig-like domain-containing protein [Paramuribaculum sp.]